MTISRVEDLEFLDAHWTRVVIGGSHIYIGGQALDYDYAFPSAADAVEFTKDRLEELRQIEAEIQTQAAILELIQNGANCCPVDGVCGAIVNVARLYRTIKRLTDASEVLLKGMK